MRGVEAGGSLLKPHPDNRGQPSDGTGWTGVTAELATMDNVTHLQNATVWAYREHNYLMVNERAPEYPDILERNWRVRAGPCDLRNRRD